MEDKFEAFLRVLDPEDNKTGGGAASAVAGAMGAGLIGMVARVSRGKQGMPQPDSFYEAANQRAVALTEALIAGSNEDARAFDAVIAGYRMPKDTEEEKAARSAAIQAGLASATETPLRTAARCAAVLDLAAELKGRSSPNVDSDLDCGVYLATAGLKGALSNAQINIASLKDPEVASEFERRVGELRQRLG